MNGCNGCDGCQGDDTCSVFGEGKLSRNLNNMEDSDAYMARELNSLSVNERDRVYEDIHGVTEAKKEDPQMIEQQLAALEFELKRLKSKPAYERALFLSPRYVTDKAFRLMFLRADEFDERKAAARIVKYFDNKRMLFGEEKLVKKLTLDDLTPDDLEEVMSGFFQQLAEKDSRGRPIIHVMLQLHRHKPWQSKIRAIWYIIMCTLEDEDAQKNGFVNVYYFVGGSAPDSSIMDTLPHASILEESLPYRNNATHFCYDSVAIRPIVQLLQLVAGKETRLRFRTHYGSHMECQFSLMSFGIRNNILPVDSAGELKKGLMEAFAEKRRSIEAAHREAIGDRIDYPGENDVIFGRGRPYQEYCGNAFLAKILNARREEYNDASRFEKTVISYDVAKVIHDKGGRFLQRDETTGGWSVVSESVAREKIASGFRTRTRLQEEHDNGIYPRKKRTKMDPALGFH